MMMTWTSMPTLYMPTRKTCNYSARLDELAWVRFSRRSCPSRCESFRCQSPRRDWCKPESNGRRVVVVVVVVILVVVAAGIVVGAVAVDVVAAVVVLIVVVVAAVVVVVVVVVVVA